MDVLRFSRAFACLAVAVAPLITLAGGCTSVVTPSGECCNDALCPTTPPTSDSACGGPAAGVSCSYYTDPASCPEVWLCGADGFFSPQLAPADGDICPV